MKIILTTACDDNFIGFLLQMLESLGDRLDKHAFGICDLGLSDASKDKIRKLKPDVIFKDPRDFIDVPDFYNNAPFLGILYRPYACDIFPNYDGYIHIDADLSFADPTGLDDMIEAGQKHGVACVNERKLFFTHRKKLFGITVFRYREGLVYHQIKRNYGKAEAKRLKGKRKNLMNGGFFFIQGGNKFWKQFQASVRKSMAHIGSDEDKWGGRFCDQTSFLYTLMDCDVPHVVLPYTHNCVAKKLIFDKETGNLFYPYSPEGHVKVVHLTGADKDQPRTLKTTDGDTVKTALTYHAIQELKAKYR